ncbi:hypothetical protein SPI_03490 [Niveomyces insectorum RCEF 264]|uniref:Uncharacterized protein n=1 Tax=Niveomyces insectorum RCEF 264 TaxID=1081102 RepID=A0A167W4F9_9HYPO|nr:hypothetical protein SPI_03490 [Niveomyces insectorum RCEF 264]
MCQITAASIIQGSEYDFLHFRALCQLEPVVNMLRTRNGVPPKQAARLLLFLKVLFADEAASAQRFGTQRRASSWARNQAELVKQDAKTLVLLGLCLTQTDLGDYGQQRLAVLLTVARVLGSDACCQAVFEESAVTSVCQAHYTANFCASYNRHLFVSRPHPTADYLTTAIGSVS